MGWRELLSAMVGLQGRRCTVQVTLPMGDEMPMLTAFGSLGGGPIADDLGTSETIILGLESAHVGNNGVLMIQERHFEDAEQVSPNRLTIRYGGVLITLTAAVAGSGDQSTPRRDP
jgi:hypothetical protein